MAASVWMKRWNCWPTLRAVLGADDAGGDGGIQAEGAAESEDPIADLHAVGIAELGDGKIVVGVDLDDGEVGFLVRADHAGVVMRGIAVEGDLNFGGSGQSRGRS